MYNEIKREILGGNLMITWLKKWLQTDDIDVQKLIIGQLNKLKK
jgi:hypothetical protein